MCNIKIVHIELGKNLYGGAKQVFYLIKGLYQKGVKNILVCPKNSEISKITDDFLYKKYEISYMGDLDISLFFRLIFLLKKERPHVLHVHSRRGADFWGGMASNIIKVPSIITRRVDNPETPLLAKIKYSLYEKIVVISLGIKEILVREGVDEKKIIHIPSGVEFEDYHRKCEKVWFLKEFNLKETDIPIGMIAQFIQRKGHDVLIKAALYVINMESNVKFLLFGKGPLEEKIRSKIYRVNLQQYIKFAGFRNDLERIIPCLYIVVHPATMEGLGVSLLQSSAAGVPIIASNVGGIPEVVKDGFNGFLINPGDPQKLAEKIIFLVRNRKKAIQMGLNGKKLVKEKFSVDNMVDSYLKLYKYIAEK